MLYGYSCFLESIVGEMLNIDMLNKRMKVYILAKRRYRLLSNRSKYILNRRLYSLDLKYFFVLILTNIFILKLISLWLN